MERCVLITGASGSIGNAIAEIFAKEKYNLFLCCNNPQKIGSLQEKADELAKMYGVETSVAAVDVSVKSECDEVIKKCCETFGGISVLVNNAGRTYYDSFIRTSEDVYSSVVECNQNGTFFMMQAAAKKMKRQRSGNIVNISSLAGLKGCPGSAAYAASKGAVNLLTHTIAHELAPYGIRVNAVAPGRISGGMSNMFDDEQSKTMLTDIPMGRYGSPEEVANVVWFLASEKSSYITGSVINVDGGML